MITLKANFKLKNWATNALDGSLQRNFVPSRSIVLPPPTREVPIRGRVILGDPKSLAMMTPVLGQYELNMVKFRKHFELESKDYQPGVEVAFTIYKNMDVKGDDPKAYRLVMKTPSLNYLLYNRYFNEDEKIPLEYLYDVMRFKARAMKVDHKRMTKMILGFLLCLVKKNEYKEKDYKIISNLYPEKEAEEKRKKLELEERKRRKLEKQKEKDEDEDDEEEDEDKPKAKPKEKPAAPKPPAKEKEVDLDKDPKKK